MGREEALWVDLKVEQAFEVDRKGGGQTSGNDRKVSCRGGVRFHKKMSFGFYAYVCSLISRDLLHIFYLYVQISVVSFFLAKHFRQWGHIPFSPGSHVPLYNL